MNYKPTRDKVRSKLNLNGAFLVSVFTISLLVIADIAEVSARGFGGGGGGRSFSGGGGRSFSGSRGGSGNLRFSGGNSNRSSFSRDTRRKPFSRDRAGTGQRDFNRQDRNPSDRQQDRQDFLDDSRNDRQDWRDQNREDWQKYGKNRQEDRQEFIEDNYYRGRHYYGGGFAAGLAVGAVIATLPSSCTTLYWGGARYYNCNNVYYQPTYRGGTTTFIVVNKPY